VRACQPKLRCGRGTSWHISLSVCGAGACRRRKKKHYVLKKTTEPTRNQLCVSQKAQPTSVSILDCSKVLKILKQNVPCLPDRDWQGHTATIENHHTIETQADLIPLCRQILSHCLAAVFCET
jgi:hypothetical protein